MAFFWVKFLQEFKFFLSLVIIFQEAFHLFGSLWQLGLMSTVCLLKVSWGLPLNQHLDWFVARSLNTHTSIIHGELSADDFKSQPIYNSYFYLKKLISGRQKKWPLKIYLLPRSQNLRVLPLSTAKAVIKLKALKMAFILDSLVGPPYGRKAEGVRQSLIWRKQCDYKTEIKMMGPQAQECR